MLNSLVFASDIVIASEPKQSPVIASEAKQSRSPRRFAPRDDGSQARDDGSMDVIARGVAPKQSRSPRRSAPRDDSSEARNDGREASQ
jgi:hypothetical protein